MRKMIRIVRTYRITSIADCIAPAAMAAGLAAALVTLVTVVDALYRATVEGGLIGY